MLMRTEGWVRILNVAAFLVVKRSANCDWSDSRRRPITIDVTFCGKKAVTFKIPALDVVEEEEGGQPPDEQVVGDGRELFRAARIHHLLHLGVNLLELKLARLDEDVEDGLLLLLLLSHQVDSEQKILDR